MSDASHRLLSAPELIELILLELDHRTLLCRAPRVSRQWRDIIDASPGIQSRLFFRPPVAGRRRGDEHRPPPLHRPRSWRGRRGSSNLHDLVQLLDCHTDDASHHVDCAQDKGISRPESNALATPSKPISRASIPHWTSETDYKSFTSRGASWRRMLIQSPPITSLGQVVVRRRIDGSVTTRVGRAACPDGLRVGQLWDSLRDSMALLRSDVCLQHLAWWEPSLTPLEGALYPMAQDVARLFDNGAQLVLALGFSECAEPDTLNGRFAREYEALCRCEDFEPLEFDMKETITPPQPSRRRQQAA